MTANEHHSCAVMQGAAKCWGNNRYGQLGDGTATHQMLPVQVAGLTSGTTSVAAGTVHTCALVEGAAKCWGANGQGQLGNKSQLDSAVPVWVELH